MGMGRGRFPNRFVKSRYLGVATRYFIYSYWIFNR
jgi:hypothetical protein